MGEIIAYDTLDGIYSPSVWQVRGVRDATHVLFGEIPRKEYHLGSGELTMWMSDLELRERNARRATDAEKAIFRLGGV